MLSLLRGPQSFNVLYRHQSGSLGLSHTLKTLSAHPLKTNAWSQNQQTVRHATWFGKGIRDDKTTEIIPPLTISKLTKPLKSKRRNILWFLAAAAVVAFIPGARLWQYDAYDSAKDNGVTFGDDGALTDEKRELLYNTWTVVAMTPAASRDLVDRTHIIDLFVNYITQDYLPMVALANFAAQPRYRDEIAKKVPWDKITNRQFALADANNTVALLQLLAEMSKDPQYAKIFNKQAMDLLGETTTVPFPPLQEKASIVLGSLMSHREFTSL